MALVTQSLQDRCYMLGHRDGVAEGDLSRQKAAVEWSDCWVLAKASGFECGKPRYKFCALVKSRMLQFQVTC